MPGCVLINKRNLVHQSAGKRLSDETVIVQDLATSLSERALWWFGTTKTARNDAYSVLTTTDDGSSMIIDASGGVINAMTIRRTRTNNRGIPQLNTVMTPCAQARSRQSALETHEAEGRNMPNEV
jgi:hypothetical protein